MKKLKAIWRRFCRVFLYRDDWTYRFERSERRLQVDRLKFAENIEERNLNPATVCTCDGCSRRRICTLAYDGYNTNGDCLYDK